MTATEICKKWYDLFILVIETAGEENGNTVYKEVEKRTRKLVEKNLNIQDSYGGPMFSEFIAFCMAYLVLEVRTEIHNGIKDLAEGKDSLKELIQDLWFRYLKKPTKKFTTKYGISSVDDEKITEVTIDIVIYKKKDEEL